MKLLKDIIYGIRIVEIKGNTNIAIESIAFDSRRINNLSLFIAVNGVSQNGHNFISDAESNGACAIICNELPENLIGKIWKGKYKGQKQKWFIVKFTGEENEININTKYPEFIEWKWIDMDLLPELIVNFKKHIYEDILTELKKYIN